MGIEQTGFEATTTVDTHIANGKQPLRQPRPACSVSTKGESHEH